MSTKNVTLQGLPCMEHIVIVIFEAQKILPAELSANACACGTYTDADAFGHFSWWVGQ